MFSLKNTHKKYAYSIC